MEITVKKSLVEMLTDFSWRLLQDKPTPERTLDTRVAYRAGWGLGMGRGDPTTARRPRHGRAEPTTRAGGSERWLLCSFLRWRR